MPQAGTLSLPNWRDAACYAWLHDAAPDSFAWEWLRRDRQYRDAAQPAARAAPPGGAGGRLRVVAGDPAAGRWGLHAFEDPGLAAHTARPVWQRGVFPRALVATADRQGEPEDRFDLVRFVALATVVRGEAGEHVLLSDGRTSLRLDITAGSVLDGPVRLAYRIAGLVAIDGPLATLHALARLCRSGRLARPAARSRTRRLTLLLRAFDALQTGATHREIAGALLGADADRARWRTEAPSLRLQAQRLAGGARVMAGGGYRSLLGS